MWLTTEKRKSAGTNRKAVNVMGNWKYIVRDFKKILKGGSLEDVQNKLRPTLENALVFQEFEDLEQLFTADTIDEFDGVLNLLYDYADEKRIWLD